MYLTCLHFDRFSQQFCRDINFELCSFWFLTVPPELFLDKKFEEVITLKRGQSTAIEIPFKGNPQPVVSWNYDGDKELPDKKRMEVQTIRNMTTCRIGKVVRTDAGEYTMKLENNVGKATLTITLNVLGRVLMFLFIIYVFL